MHVVRIVVLVIVVIALTAVRFVARRRLRRRERGTSWKSLTRNQRILFVAGTVAFIAVAVYRLLHPIHY